jgi:ribokinase
MAASPARICVVGSINVDLTFRAPRLPRPGETVTGHGFQQGFGGKGANQAVAAARLGAQVTMIGRVGNDAFGTQALHNLQANGIDTRFIRADAQRPTGIAAIVLDDAATNCIVVIPGANGALAPADIHTAADAIRSADVVICQLEVPLDTVLETFRIARSAGVRTILNPAPAQPLPAELLENADICVPNETELELLTGRDFGEVEAIAVAAQELSATVQVVVTLGGSGAWVQGEIMTPPAVAALDSTGAGDTFIGCLAVSLVEGLSLREAVRRANVAAALSVTRLGTQTAIPTRAEVEALLAEHDSRR